jgi:hypothetical protein
MNKYTAAELISVTPFKEDKTWYLALAYEYEDEKGKHIVEIPKAVLPLIQGRLPSIKSESFYVGTHVYIDCKDSMTLYAADSAFASKRGSKILGYCFDIITEPISREMTLDEIEKELGYKVKIINKKK